MMRCCCSLCLRASHSHGQMSACYEIRSPDQIISRSSLHQRITEELTHTQADSFFSLRLASASTRSSCCCYVCLTHAVRRDPAIFLSLSSSLHSLSFCLICVPRVKHLPSVSRSSLALSLSSLTLTFAPKTETIARILFHFLSLSLFLVLLFVVLRESV